MEGKLYLLLVFPLFPIWEEEKMKLCLLRQQSGFSISLKETGTVLLYMR